MAPEPNGSKAAVEGTKKKRNRKKKTKTGPKEEKAPVVKEPQNALNPAILLRNKLIANEGFSQVQIDKAMEEMWDEQLPYDEYESVFKYLKSGAKAFAQAQAVPLLKEAPTKVKAALVKEMAAPTPEPEYEDGDEEDSGVEESKEIEESTTSSDAQSQISMASKLDMVAGFENLTDGAFALTEWVAKVAKPHELEELCAAKTTLALPTIIQRSITECEDQSQFDGAVLPSVIRLHVAILTKSGIAAASIATSRVSFESVIKLARKAFLLQTNNHEDEKEFAKRVAKFMASRIAIAVEESKFAMSTENGGTTTAPKLQEEVDLLTTGKTATSSMDSDISQLVSKRDMYKSAAKKSMVVARMALNTLASQNGFLPTNATDSHSSREVEMEKSDIFLAIVGAQGQQVIHQQRAHLHDLKTQVQAQEPEHITELRSSEEDYISERQIIAQRIAELRQSIEKLEIYDAELCSKVLDIQADIEGDVVSRSVKNSQLDESLLQAQTAVKFGNSIGSLVDLLKAYDDSLEKAVNGSGPAFASTDNMGEVVSSKMDAFLVRARNYFTSEAECVDFLRARISSSETTVGELTIEIAECEGLGMATTVAQMEDSLKAKQELVAKDTALLERLVEEAATMFDVLITRLEQYTVAGDNGQLLSTDYTTTLQFIPACIVRLGVARADRLHPFLTNLGNGNGHHQPLPTAMAPLVMSQAPSMVSPIRAPFPPVAGRVSAMPKLSWAVASKPTDQSQKTSLLDIQKEELQSKTE